MLRTAASVVGVAVLSVLTVLTVLTAAGAAQAAPAAGGEEPAPECVHYAATWRYTHVTNACDTAYRLTVEYTDGTGVPCREAQPGATVTFPGYGPGGNGVVRVRLCPPPH
ncbi:alpha-amylase [Streptomyces sp. PKU-MA01144]|uniref:alpha-amylase n=1 Tax=Streptomyces sp. PKU-MA01144 TaxID=2729138 RepID=UPI00147CEBE0|nr:alpha-amylase [Streptomyces sp. PKU-MA01144]NNJ05478.1 alpha-amylase [Streptomyces sp. PKU-MA01144]